MFTRSPQDNYKDSANFDYETRIIRLSPSRGNYPTNQPSNRQKNTQSRRKIKLKL